MSVEGQFRPWCSIGRDGSLPLSIARAARIPATEGAGHERKLDGFTIDAVLGRIELI
jgi:hypothetical protein